MPTKLPLIIGIFIVFLLAGVFLLMQSNQGLIESAPSQGNESDELQEQPQGSVREEEQPTPEQSTLLITHTENGFMPSALRVEAGTTVTFRNESIAPMWPASAMHPMHTVYPGSSIEKCGASEQPSIFDACAGIASGSEWSFTFSQIGTWRYHDHLQPSHFGTVVVE